jgi:hypothetical protein
MERYTLHPALCERVAHLQRRRWVPLQTIYDVIFCNALLLFIRFFIFIPYATVAILTVQLTQIRNLQMRWGPKWPCGAAGQLCNL